MEDFQLGAPSANLTASGTGSVITVLAEEYMIEVDYTTSFVDYRILPYFCTDFIRYRRVNPLYSWDGTLDEAGNALNSVSMTISCWGRAGNAVWFLESCPEFSLNQTFRIYRDYVELDVTYEPGTEKVITTYFFGLYSADGEPYPMVDGGHHYRYVPGYEEDRPAEAGMGGWYPSPWMYAPACDLRARNKDLGVEVGLNETACYLGSPIWMNEPGAGGESVFATKYCSKDSVVPNVALGMPETFHLFIRPYQYTDGQDRGHDAGYAQWVAPQLAAAYGHPVQPAFPLLVMDMAPWSADFRDWVEGSQVKVATRSEDQDQYDWAYKCCQLPNKAPGLPSDVPVSWQVYSAPGVPMTISDGRVICNPVSGPYDSPGTYRWQLINNDSDMEEWTGSRGVFWDMMIMWNADTKLRSDYNLRQDFIMEGYLGLISDSFECGYWDYVMSNTFSALLHTSMASSISMIQGYRPSSACGTDMAEHVHSTMNFTANMPEAYRPRILVYQSYDSTDNVDDQEDVYDVLFGSAEYGFHVTLVSYHSFASQMHNYVMAEEMFKAMGCTRDSDARISVGTLDLAMSQSLTTSAAMAVIKGDGTATISVTEPIDEFKVTNLNDLANNLELRVPGGAYLVPGPGVTSLAPMTYTADGMCTFSGSVQAEKTAVLTRNTEIEVTQSGTGSASVILVATGPSADLTIGSTGGTTQLKLKGFVPGMVYDVLVDSALVDRVVADPDGSITFSRTYGADQRVQTRLSSSQDHFAPRVISFSPVNGATEVPVSAQVRVTFNESMERSSAQAAFGLSAPSSVGGAFSWESSDTVLVFTPSQPLPYGRSCTVQVSTSARDLSGNALPTSCSSSFVTEGEPIVLDLPSAPLGLIADGSARSVSLSWSPPADDGGPGISGYIVYRGTSPAGQGSTPAATLGNVTSYLDEGLTDGTTYCYQVSAFNVVGEGPKSQEAQATTFDVPGMPAALSAVGSMNSVSLSWAAPSSDGGSPVTGYVVYRGGSPSALAAIAALGDALNFEDLDVANGMSLYYAVSALNAVGEGQMSSSVNCVPGFVPSAPMALMAQPSDSQVLLSWQAPVSDNGHAIIGYTVHRGTSPDDLSSVASLGLSLDFVDVAVSNGQTYYYRITASNDMGEGALSDLASAKPATVPGMPTALLSAGSAGAVDLSWGAPESDGGDAVQGYVVFRGSPSGSFTQVANVASTSYRDSGLQRSTTYHYEVKAYNSMGIGPASSTSATTAGPPREPLGLGAEPTSDGACLAWSAPSGDGGAPITGYNVYRGPGQSSLALLAAVAGLSYYDEGLEPGATYVYAVSAVNAVGEGALSSIEGVTIPAQPPAPPRNMSAQASSVGIDLHWDSPSGDGGSPVLSYRLYRGTSPESLTYYAETSSNRYLDRDVAPGQAHYYRATAVNAAGEGRASAVASATVALPPGAPSDLRADRAKASVELTWQAPSQDGGSPVTGYVIYRGRVAGHLSELVTLGPVLQFSDYSLPRFGTVYYRVSAINSAGEGDTSDEASAYLTRKASPPKRLSATSQDQSVLLLWELPDDHEAEEITSYAVYRRGPDGTVVKVAAVNSTSLVDMGVTNGVTYAYSVAAINDLGEGNLTEFVSVKPFGPPSSPPYLIATPHDGMVLLEWGRPTCDGGDNISGFAIFMVENGEETLLTNVSPEVSSYACYDLQNGRSYGFSIAAINARGQSIGCSVLCTPMSDLSGPSATPFGIDAPGGLLAMAAMVGAASVLLLLTRERRRNAARRRRAGTSSAAKADIPTEVVAQSSRAPLPQARVVRVVPKVSPPPQANLDEAAFERTVKDLEVSNRIL